MLNQWLAGCVAAFVRLVSGTTPRLVGWSPDARPSVYFANHSSHLDAIVIWAMLPPALRRRARPVAARDYWGKNKMRQWFARRIFKAILIDRRGVHGIAASLEAMRAALSAGDSLIIFPEGTRGDGISIGPFKPGLFHLAKGLPELDFVPVYLQNLNRILPKGEFLPVPLLSSASFGPPLRLQEGELSEAFLARTHAAVIALMPEAQPC